MATPDVADREALIRAAYEALFELVSQGRITEADPMQVLIALNDAWARSPSAIRLAAALLDYAYQQALQRDESDVADKTRVRRQRLYGIAQQLYERVRLAPPGAAAPLPA